MCPQTARRVLGTQPGNPVQTLEAGWPGGGGVGTSNVTLGQGCLCAVPVDPLGLQIPSG